MNKKAVFQRLQIDNIMCLTRLAWMFLRIMRTEEFVTMLLKGNFTDTEIKKKRLMQEWIINKTITYQNK